MDHSFWDGQYDVEWTISAMYWSLFSNYLDNLTCKFGYGDGIGKSEIRQPNMSPAKCIKRCKLQKKSNSAINGVTIDGGKTLNYCWCEVGMTRASSTHSYQTCMLKPG